MDEEADGRWKTGQFFFFDGENFQVQKFLFKTIFVTTISYNIQLKDNIPNWEISPQTLSKKEGKKKKDKKKKNK